MVRYKGGIRTTSTISNPTTRSYLHVGLEWSRGDIIAHGPGMVFHIVNLIVMVLMPMVVIHVKDSGFSLCGCTLGQLVTGTVTGTGAGAGTGTGASIEDRLAREFSEFPERFG
ncbi:hypothetical protein M0804_014074 [Polistes exclamans]|nr:hypothetical protein M0804_014075 [Polistes exclamans]KAI4475802.1 hypothetical protein M0804_014074 [Polistes exclamans]